jgi:class 3 adenylate cyclase
MALASELEEEVAKIFRESWSSRDGQVIPLPENLRLGNDAVELDATVLYADLADSTGLVNTTGPQFAAEIYKTFLSCSARIIKKRGGQITAYDGDRVMAVFVGDYKNTAAAQSALQINGAVTNIIKPRLKAQYTAATYELGHSVGIDSSKLLVARIGVKNDNDLVWVGRAANYAAKLCALREGEYKTWITGDVFDKLNDKTKVFTDGRQMWEQRSWTARAGLRVYRSSWWWSPDHLPT